jgi:hypothetical protein
MSTPGHEGDVEALEGWSAIASYVSNHAGFEVSVASAMRWAKAMDDPLPLRRWRKGRRVFADAGELVAWCRRQWVG